MKIACSNTIRSGRLVHSPMSKPPATPNDGFRTLTAVSLISLALVVMTFAIYGQTIRHGFFNVDDDENITAEPAVYSGLTLRGGVWAFTHTQARRWTPLATLSREADCQIFGLWAGGHHLVSALLHALVSIVVFFALRSLTGALRRSALVAALFAVHPLHVEPVAWLSSRGELLCGLLFMMGLWSYSLYARKPNASGYVLLHACFVLGCMSKPSMVAFPLVLLLLDYWPLGRMDRLSDLRPRLLEKLPLFVIGLLTALAAICSEQPIPTPWNHLPMMIRMENDLAGLLGYLGKIFWPVGLSYGYPIPKHGPGFPTGLAGGSLLAAMGWTAYRLRAKSPYLGVGLLWYLVTLAPTMAFVQSNTVSYGDRYAYIPLVGLSIATVWLAGDLTARWQPNLRNGFRITAVILALGGLATLSFLQTRWWRDNLTLWHHTLDCTGENAFAEANIGKIVGVQGRYREALEHANRALGMEPLYADAHLLAGVANFYLKRYDRAISECEEAVRLRPDFGNYRIALTEAKLGLAESLLHRGLSDRAIAEYREAILLQPGSAKSHNNLGVALIREGRTEEAIGEFREVLRLEPQSQDARGNLQKALLLKESAGLPKDGRQSILQPAE